MDSFRRDLSHCSEFSLDSISVPAEPKVVIQWCKSARFRIPIEPDVEKLDVKEMCAVLAARVEAIIYAIEHGISYDSVVHLSDVRGIPEEHRRPTLRYAENHFVEFGDDNETYLQELAALKASLENAA